MTELQFYNLIDPGAKGKMKLRYDESRKMIFNQAQ